MKTFSKIKKMNRGEMLIFLMIIIFLMSTMLMPVVTNVATELKAGTSVQNRELALQIAEAGINYYQWHLAHFTTDYQDGTGAAGPYVHSYVDKDTEQTIGTFSLTITPPTTGSTIVTIASTGYTTANPSVTRTITARYGIPSLALYSFLSNDIIWIGDSETVNGEMQSNNGIRFDGDANAPIMSAKSTYTCPSNQGCSGSPTKAGIWGSATSAVQSFWQFPVPSVDFSALTSNLSSLKADAQCTSPCTGIYLPPSTVNGYSLVFKSNGTIDVYKVTSLVSEPTGTGVDGTPHNENIDYSTRSFQYNKAVPTNGVIYVEDNVWVEGTVKGRVMVAAANLPYSPSTAPTIYIPNNLVYSAKDGTDVLGLLAQDDVVVTYGAPSTLEIDAAMIAQNGSCQFFFYSGVVKSSISVYGSIMSYGQWTWSWVNGSGTITSGYSTTSDTYDTNLLYGPPPVFPLSSSGYQQLSWTSN